MIYVIKNEKDKRRQKILVHTVQKKQEVCKSASAIFESLQYNSANTVNFRIKPLGVARILAAISSERYMWGDNPWGLHENLYKTYVWYSRLISSMRSFRSSDTCQVSNFGARVRDGGWVHLENLSRFSLINFSVNSAKFIITIPSATECSILRPLTPFSETIN